MHHAAQHLQPLISMELSVAAIAADASTSQPLCPAVHQRCRLTSEQLCASRSRSECSDVHQQQKTMLTSAVLLCCLYCCSGLGSNPESLKWFAESERVHARWAMLAVAGILVQVCSASLTLLVMRTVQLGQPTTADR